MIVLLECIQNQVDQELGFHKSLTEFRSFRFDGPEAILLFLILSTLYIPFVEHWLISVR